jgi:hypothetical protein
MLTIKWIWTLIPKLTTVKGTPIESRRWQKVKRTILYTNHLNIHTCFQKYFDKFKLSSRTWTLIWVRHTESFSFFLFWIFFLVCFQNKFLEHQTDQTFHMYMRSLYMPIEQGNANLQRLGFWGRWVPHRVTRTEVTNVIGWWQDNSVKLKTTFSV